MLLPIVGNNTEDNDNNKYPYLFCSAVLAVSTEEVSIIVGEQ